MSATRSRKEDVIYKKYLINEKKGCTFCAIKKGDKQFVSDSRSFKVIRNIFAYSIWDGQKVSDHLMVLPKRHTDSLGSLMPSQAVEFLKIIDKYEREGYNIYARAPASKIKSVVHQHTHLIKTEGNLVRFLLLMRRPFYFRIPR